MSSTVLFKGLLVCLGFFSVVALNTISRSLSKRLALKHIPGPESFSIIWGQEWHLYNSIPGSLYSDWHGRFGKVVRFTGAFGHQVLSITDPRAISFILGEGAYDFPKPEGVRAWFKATIGAGIIWVEGKSEHEAQRRILAPALSQQSVRNLVPVFVETSTKLATQWLKIMETHHGEEVEIEVTNWVGRFALDTIGRSAFTHDFNCLDGEPHGLADALDGLTNSEHDRYSFYMRSLFWLFPSILKIGKKGEMIRKSKTELGNISLRMWRDAKVVGEWQDKTLLDLILKADACSQNRMSEEEIVAQMRTIISAGYETVSAIIAWLLYELARNPEIQEQLRKEISAKEISLDVLNNQCVYLDAVLKETLRLHPAVLENHHEASKTISVPLSEPLPGANVMFLVIPKHTLISIPVNVLQSDMGVWGHDADLFRPERWIERKSETHARPGRDLLAFSAGPRSCIGKSFATAEIKTLVVILLRHFSFACSYEIEPFQSFVIRPRVKGQSSSSLPLLVRRI